MTARCSACGRPNADDATFCLHCNHFLAWSEAPPTRAAPVTATPAPPAAPPPAAPPPAAPPPAVPPPAPASPAPATGAPDARTSLLQAVADTRRLAADRGRGDLVARLDATEERVRSNAVTVAVVGEFKRGKSSLVNALLQRTVCPVDADIVTAVPTLVRYGEQAAATAYRHLPDNPEPIARAVPPQQLVAVISEGADVGADEIRSVEVRVPHRILRTGLRLLDTPGVGGLESAHGQLTLGAIAAADGVLFVTDAAQELTAPEMDFLRIVLDRCPRAAVMVTKTDLHQHWRRIVELDRGHLRRAGIDVPVLPVSSLLRLQAKHRPDLNEESGFAALVEFLARAVVRPVNAEAAATAAHQVDFVADQLARQLDAERVVLARPEQGAQVVRRLSAAHDRAQALGSSHASWQQLLNDGVQDLVADVEHDLQARLRRVLKETRDQVDQSDPRDAWVETGAWLRREVAAAGVANRDLLVARASALAEEVSSAFSSASTQSVEVELDLVTKALDELQLPSATSFVMPGGRLASLMVTARTTAIVPMLAISVGGALPALLPFVAGGALLLTSGIGARLFRNESRRHLDYRRQQAKAAAAKFVEEAAFEMNKTTRDSLRRTQRLLRDELTSQAQTIAASTSSALDAAQRARALDPAAQARRSAELDVRARRLGSVRQSLQRVSTAGASGG